MYIGRTTLTVGGTLGSGQSLGDLPDVSKGVAIAAKGEDGPGLGEDLREGENGDEPRGGELVEPRAPDLEISTGSPTLSMRQP